MPSSSDAAYIDNGGTAVLQTPGQGTGNIRIGRTNFGTLSIPNGGR